MKINIIEKMHSVISEIKEISIKNEKNIFLCVVFLIIILANGAARKLNIRFDLTGNQTYSLTDKSKQVVANLKENLTIKVIFSQKLSPNKKQIYQYVKDLLHEYDNYGNKHFSYVVIENEEELKTIASDYNIPIVNDQELSDDSAKVSNVYMGIVFQHGDMLEKIDSVTTTRGLEFLITSKIQKLNSKIDNLLALENPITATLYTNRDLKKFYEKDIEVIKGVFTESNKIYFDKLLFKVVDDISPDKNKELEEKFGIKNRSWESMRNTEGVMIPEGSGPFGILFENNGKYAILNPMLTIKGIVGSETFKDNLENAITAMVASNTEIGYIVGHGEPDVYSQYAQRDPASGFILAQVLSDMYQLRPINLAKEDIPENIHTIIVNGPKKQLTDIELLKIDQHLMSGKAGLFFVEPFNEVQMKRQQFQFQQQPPIFIPVRSGLEALLKSYGIFIHNDYVLDEQAFENPRSQQPLYLLPIITHENLNRTSVMTKYLNRLALFKASSITVDDNYIKSNNIIKKELVKTSSGSWLIKGQVDYSRLLAPPSGENAPGQHVVAVHVAGKFISHFKDKDIKDDTQSNKKNEKHVVEKRLNKTIASGKTNIVVVGSSEITKSQFLKESPYILSAIPDGTTFDTSQNALFLHSIIDELNNNTYIPEMKFKSVTFNPLHESDSKLRFILKIINIGLLPLFIMLIGFILWKKNGKRKKKIMKEFT